MSSELTQNPNVRQCEHVIEIHVFIEVDKIKKDFDRALTVIMKVINILARKCQFKSWYDKNVEIRMNVLSIVANGVNFKHICFRDHENSEFPSPAIPCSIKHWQKKICDDS
jgi:hypothetical protein